MLEIVLKAASERRMIVEDGTLGGLYSHQDDHWYGPPTKLNDHVEILRAKAIPFKLKD